MYKPAPPRPKKTNIVRSRSGCKACRQRRVKCDEKKPSCSACVRRENKCEAIAPSFDFRTGFWSAHKPPGVRATERSEEVCEKEIPIKSTTSFHGISVSDDIPEIPEVFTSTEDDLALAHQLTSEEWILSEQLSYESPGSSSLLQLPSPISTKSFRRSEDELFYLTYWENSCTRSLPALSQICDIARDHAPLMQAILALSACNLSRSSPEGGNDASQVMCRPRRDYLLSSQHYYSSAIAQIARAINESSLEASPRTLAVLLLFCCFESAMGNFAGFGCHAQAVDSFIQQNLESISSDPLGGRLTAAWVLAKSQNWWLRMHFSSISFQLSQRSPCPSREVSNLLHSTNARRALVTSILCKSYCLNNIALIQLGPCGRPLSDLSLDTWIVSLQVESKKLDEWHSALPHSELPIESFSTFDTLDTELIRPLRFTSHFLAMNYAYYACARMMQCTSLLYDLQRSHDQSIDPDEVETTHWMYILLRVVAGLDKLDCSRENVYSIGVSSLLVACLLRCHNVAFGRWAETWLYEWSKIFTLEEGSFPIAQALQATRLINAEKAAGNDVYAIALAEDDAGGSGKYESYHSQHLDEEVLIGRRRSSRRLYSKIIPWGYGPKVLL